MTLETKGKIRIISAYFLSILGALGVALQNYISMSIFLQTIISGAVSLSRGMNIFIQTLAVGLGGLCSGVVNLFMNIDLLNDFFKRITGEIDEDKKLPTNLTKWQKVRLYGGSAIFIISGILFGLTAFTIGLASPLAVLAVASGIFVAFIMVIQELETWISSFVPSKKPVVIEKKPTTFKQKIKNILSKVAGPVIAAGNVIGLSLLFTLGLGEFLMLVGVAALPAFIIAVTISFTIGAFTEFYFYNVFLSDFCQAFSERIKAMNETKFAPFGYFCVISNAIVNGALTYVGVGLITGLIASAGLALPPVALMIVICSVCAVFVSSASLILGTSFWIGKMTKAPKNIEKPACPMAELNTAAQVSGEAPANAQEFYQAPFLPEAATASAPTLSPGIELGAGNL